MKQRMRYASAALLIGGTLGLLAGCQSSPKKTTMDEPYVGSLEQKDDYRC